MATRQPSAAKASAVARPIPWLEAATIATRFFRPVSIRVAIIKAVSSKGRATVPCPSPRMNVNLDEREILERTKTLGIRFREDPMAPPAKYVWVDAELRDAAQASVPVVNAGLHYGFSVFEGIGCYDTYRDAPAIHLQEPPERQHH